MDVKEFRSQIAEAFEADNFVEKRLSKGGWKVWTREASTEVTSYFSLDAQRRPWGFRLLGIVGIEIPTFRLWLDQHKPDTKRGIFQEGFTGYYTANDEVLGGLHVNHGQSVPAGTWVQLIKNRLDLIPGSLDLLIDTYRNNRRELGWLDHVHDEVAWDFLIKWHENPDPALCVPHRLSNGQVVYADPDYQPIRPARR